MKKIFVVDDEKIIRLLVKEILAKGGYQAEAFESAQEVMDRLATDLPDLLITDIFMPDKSGLEMILELRKTYTDLKIIAISGDASPGSEGASKDSLDVAEALGSSHIIEKPFTAAQVLEAVRTILEPGAVNAGIQNA